MCATGRQACALRASSIARLALPGVTLGRPSACRGSEPRPLVLAASAVGQPETGTIKGRLIWGDEKTPEVKELVAKGQSPKDPAVCAATRLIMSRDLVVDPKTKGVSYGIAFLFKPVGDYSLRSKHCSPRTRRSCSTRRGASSSRTCCHSTKTRRS